MIIQPISIKNMPFKNSFLTTALLKVAAIMLACFFSLSTYAAIDVYDFDSTQQEAQYRGLIEELRCPKCQNQNLAGSDAPIAQDLKQKTYDLVKDGRSDGEIRVYMQDRYGDFISYKPPVRSTSFNLDSMVLSAIIIDCFNWRLVLAKQTSSGGGSWWQRREN